MTTAEDIRRDLIAQALEVPGGMGLGTLVAMESNLREANGLPGRIPELDGIGTPAELSFQRSGACGQSIAIGAAAADALEAHNHLTTPAPAEPAPTNERHTMATELGIAHARVDVAPRSETANAALARATRDIATPLDDFGPDQTNAWRAFNLTDPEANEWLDNLTPEEARGILEMLNGITDEHRKRANAAEGLAGSIRERFRNVAGWAENPAVPSRG